jgi:DNA polymerase III epsilon subunit-like protein
MDEHLLRYDKSKELVFIDCETMNLCLNRCNNLPWQIAMLKVKGSKIIESKDLYIKWDTDLKISKEAAEITRFDPTKVEKLGITPESAFKQVSEWLTGCDYIVGHNLLGFDIYLFRMLYKEFGAVDLYREIPRKIIDTLSIAKGVKLGLPYDREEDFLAYQYKTYHIIKKGLKCNLRALGKENKIEHDYERLHDALVDLELNLKVWNVLKWQIDI